MRDVKGVNNLISVGEVYQEKYKPLELGLKIFFQIDIVCENDFNIDILIDISELFFFEKIIFLTIDNYHI